MMATIIIHQEESSIKLNELLNSVRQASPEEEILLISPHNVEQDIRIIKWEEALPLAEALTHINSSNVLLLDSRYSASAQEIRKIKEASAKHTPFTFGGLALTQKGSCVQWPDSLPEYLPDLISGQEELPLFGAVIEAELLKRIPQTNLHSAAEIILYSFINATAEAENVIPAAAALEEVELSSECLTLTLQQRAAALEYTANQCNLESLFPQHAWLEHQEESAAASYHALAAIFIRLEAPEPALECLSLSDNFEDSPRSLALKGLIAMQSGETLTAVANMVSSLQQYETRKKENEQHYTRFLPNDIEVINRKLNLGLTALNHRDNKTAAQHFADAVFSFDDFYGKHKIGRMQ